ncbi:hypothetical protein NAT51_17960 [Flavobacterium amniphilum]|uniref:hypothetical protein n=1 Tax=Flavobacterium amniphilum TaxID=1834035 RepID=UPI002029E506|nr:hypothetical protein [Flavobacterium amniphilum]MCL9807418.1 hypothetical protein [Flavobacterium amniphilum]
MADNVLKDILLDYLDKELIQYNFKLNKKLGEFTSKSKEGWKKLQLIFLIRDEGWEINLGMLIRKDLVENIYHKASYYEPKYHKITPTIGTTIENYINDGKNHRFCLNSNKDLAFCYTEILKLFKEIALPFFEKYDRIEEIEKAVNMKNRDSVFSGIKYGGNIGIILAKLVDNPDYEYGDEDEKDTPKAIRLAYKNKIKIPVGMIGIFC